MNLLGLNKNQNFIQGYFITKCLALCWAFMRNMLPSAAFNVFQHMAVKTDKNLE